MFQFIFFHVFEIFVVSASVAIIAVLVFAIRYRMKENENEQTSFADEAGTREMMKVREVGMASAGIAQTYTTDEKPAATDDTEKKADN